MTQVCTGELVSLIELLRKNRSFDVTSHCGSDWLASQSQGVHTVLERGDVLPDVTDHPPRLVLHTRDQAVPAPPPRHTAVQCHPQSRRRPLVPPPMTRGALGYRQLHRLDVV